MSTFQWLSPDNEVLPAAGVAGSGAEAPQPAWPGRQRRRRDWDTRLSTDLSILLRHDKAAGTARNVVHVRPDGLAHLDEICAALNALPFDIMDVVENSWAKGNWRFEHVHNQVHGTWIRATCSHSLPHVLPALVKQDAHECLLIRPPSASGAGAGPGADDYSYSTPEMLTVLRRLLGESRKETADLRRLLDESRKEKEHLQRQLDVSAQRIADLESSQSSQKVLNMI